MPDSSELMDNNSTLSGKSFVISIYSIPIPDRGSSNAMVIKVACSMVQPKADIFTANISRFLHLMLPESTCGLPYGGIVQTFLYQ